MGNGTRIYPLYKEAAEKIAEDSKIIFYNDLEISEMVEEKPDTMKYQFALMQLIRELLYEHGIDFIRSENEELGKGYKIATPKESIQKTADRLNRRMLMAIHKQRRVLDTIDRSNLPKDLRDDYDRKMVRNGATLSFIHKVPLSKCNPGLSVRVDVPRLLPAPQSE